MQVEARLIMSMDDGENASGVEVVQIWLRVVAYPGADAT